MAKTLDEILRLRRSTRTFTDQVPPRELIDEIIDAGLLAPYAAQAVGADKDFRKFYVFRKGGNTLSKIKTLMQAEAAKRLAALREELARKPFLEKQLLPYIEKLELIKEKGVPGVGTAPYYIIIAEKKGIPPVEQQSLAHCLQNMWLKATELGLGFQLVSMTADMTASREFCEILRITGADYAVNGCAIGFAAGLSPGPSTEKTDKINRIVEELD
jgi:nitroreductase